MVDITSVTTKVLETHLRNPGFTTTYGPEPTTRHHVVVSIKAEDGTIGIGEACPLPFTVDADYNRIKNMVDRTLGLYLVGKDSEEFESHCASLLQTSGLSMTAMAGVDMALYDLVGRLRSVPVYELLGRSTRKTVELAAVLGIGDLMTTERSAIQCVKNGVRAIKIKVGLDPEQDIETLKAVRAAVGDAVHIRADANGGYSLDTALDVLRATEDMNLEYLEQPLSADDYEGLRTLREECNIPIMVDESLHSLADAERIIQAEAADFFGMKLIKHGGLFEAKRIAAMAERNGIECVMISPWETQLGVAGAVHLAISAENFKHPHELGIKELIDDPMSGLTEQHGTLGVSNRSGLGVHLVT